MSTLSLLCAVLDTESTKLWSLPAGSLLSNVGHRTVPLIMAGSHAKCCETVVWGAVGDGVQSLVQLELAEETPL